MDKDSLITAMVANTQITLRFVHSCGPEVHMD